MRVQPMQFFNTFVRVFIAALPVLAALPGHLTAQQNNAAVSSSAASLVSSTVPQIIQFSGTLGGSASVPSGTVSITFTLYENEQGGTALWSETDNVRVDAQGHYTALLGSASPQGLPVSLFTTAQAHWLAVQPLLEGFGEQPRVLLVSAPYALKAGDAETIGGLPPSAFMLATPGKSASGSAPSSSGSAPVASPGTSAGQPIPPAVSGSGIKHYIPIWTSSRVLGNSVIYQAGEGTEADVGINMTTPGFPLDVNGDINSTYGYTIGGYQFVMMPGNTIAGNTALGVFVLNRNTTGEYNTGSGFDVLFYNTTGNDNTASGFDALYSNTTGGSNTATGYEALYNFNDTTGGMDFNVASGYQALFSDTTGNDNTADGASALYSNTTGNANTASGQNALYSNTTGDFNAALGSATLFYNTTGSSNTATGEGAQYNTTTGSYNTANGQNALKYNTSGSNNIAIGYQAADDVSGGNSNNIHIGSEGSSGDSGTIRLGTSGTQTSSYIAGIYGVTLPTSGQPLVCVDSSGQLGTANCATSGGPSAQQEAINQQQQQIQNQKALLLEQQGQLKAQQALLKTQQAQITELASQMKMIQASLRTRHRSGHARLASAKGNPTPIAPDPTLQAGSTMRGGN
jgi:hypothetical protein